MERNKNPWQPCPYCDDNSGECKHVLLNYDVTFGEYLSGFLANDDHEIEAFKSELAKLIKQGVKPNFNDDFYELKCIWEYALENYDKDNGIIFLDTDSYFRYLDQTVGFYKGVSFHYPDEEDDDNDIPGYSSACIIFYSEDPETTIKRFNDDFIENLLSFKD